MKLSATKRLLNLDLDKRSSLLRSGLAEMSIKGSSLLRSELVGVSIKGPSLLRFELVGMSIKGLLYFDLDLPECRSKGLLYFDLNLLECRSKSLKSRGSLQMLKNSWAALSPSIKNIINEAGFGTFFETLLNQDTHKYKDLQLLLALIECFWDTTCTFHFPSIGEVMLTPYDFSVITGLRLGGERIFVNDSLTSTELKKLLGVVPSRMRSNNIPLSWHCETVAKGAHVFMLLFIGTFLCSKLGSTVNLCYLGSLRKIEQIRNYD
ncbi:hypothetical protein SO802_015732 [Lithocarpus litseifolius]|uniref:Aminotransferase-like plant mobile domain-containing protein n=1 Tax=Lithocarpus litseifolius TaxID=425828 RepID=A0AAW2CY56_9ROSI